LEQRQIARSCSIGQSTVFDYLKRAEAAGLRWPLPDDWDDDRIERSLSPMVNTRDRRHSARSQISNRSMNS